MRFQSCFALLALASGLLLCCVGGAAQTVVFRQAGFPSVDSEPISEKTFAAALGDSATFVDVRQLASGEALKSASLLVLPYGSAFPAGAWPSILGYLQRGGNLLLIGGQPLRVPVSGDHEGSFRTAEPQDSYSRGLDFRHSYAVPLPSGPLQFRWRPGYEFLPPVDVQATRIFAEEGRLRGLGFLDASDGTHLAAPVIVSDHLFGSRMLGSRVLALPFSAKAGYWNSENGASLLRSAAQYARAGAAALQIEVQYSAVRPGEIPQLSVHLHQSPHTGGHGFLDAQLITGDRILERAHVAFSKDTDVALPFKSALPAGVYTVHATWTPEAANAPQEFAENGFVVEDLSALDNGEKLSVQGDFLSLSGKPFFPVGTNYFSTEENGWDFSGPRNAAVWERDFADMQSHGVNFVRTGVWMGAGKFIDPATGAANERFLRNLEAYLSAAHRHRVVVNFTFFSFTPKVAPPQPSGTTEEPTPPNPYLDEATLKTEKGYITSIVQRFGKLPWLCYDLINEPSFSNPRNIFHGNVPNGDPAEMSAWHSWLEARYTNLGTLAAAWRTTPADLGDWSSIALPKPADMNPSRIGNDHLVRAFDYNLFAQDTFSQWVRGMVTAIHAAGSRQLVNVGQDEGGVGNRLLNQFYATAGVSFTTNHTYWQDDALLWDSVAAKRPGMPNITGETGYQPAWDPDGTWRYDELTGAAIEERKWALGFAAGSSGAVQWDWAREVDFGMQRSDGSAKIWESMLRELGTFAQKAAPYATGLTLPEVALVLPQSRQLSTYNTQAIEAQQTAVRALYHYDRVEAYAVGEYQIDALGTPKLIILPSAYGLSDSAWAAIEARVRAGAVLLASGPFGADEHMHPTDRMKQLGLHAAVGPLQLRDLHFHFPGGDVPLEYRGMSTTVLDRATLPLGEEFAEIPLGKGKILFSALPLELNSNLESVARVYAYALKSAGVRRTYTTTMQDPGILVCPTRLPHATLYVLTSETSASAVTFRDHRSGKSFSGRLEAGRAAVLLVGEEGRLVAAYGWHPSL